MHPGIDQEHASLKACLDLSREPGCMADHETLGPVALEQALQMLSAFLLGPAGESPEPQGAIRVNAQPVSESQILLQKLDDFLCLGRAPSLQSRQLGLGGRHPLLEAPERQDQLQLNHCFGVGIEGLDLVSDSPVDLLELPGPQFRMDSPMQKNGVGDPHHGRPLPQPVAVVSSRPQGFVIFEKARRMGLHPLPFMFLAKGRWLLLNSVASFEKCHMILVGILASLLGVLIHETEIGRC